MNATALNKKHQSRAFLWAAPRTISTAFFRAMMNKQDIKVLLEPFSRAYYFSSERVSSRYRNEPTQDNCTFKDIKALCEKEYPGYSSIFVKDMAYYLVGRLQHADYIPEGYRHTFLIRNPQKSVYSLYKMSLNKELTGWDHFDASEVGFKELVQVYNLVTEELGQQAIIVDADDLLKYPDSLLKQYCEKVGMEYEESMLNWEQTAQNMNVFEDWMPWFEGVLTSTTFQPSATKPKSPNIMPDLPKHVRQAIDDNMPSYNKLYRLRIKPQVNSSLAVGQ
ncbi:DgyrCDS13064 [Dimorphilus gyrociliatus]|uniref:DgyrCDS13064 n=1 Tax=Dimorphilus gyrociliatus TaxID=2664684 RepID=A0A7I8W9I8_9ANNE|nr:DgyrCDS13064 [Dimorphilus gyrociliatus]